MLLVGLFCVFATPASGFDFSSIHAERNNRSQALHAEPEETSGRRLFLGQFLATTTATMASPLVAHADPSALSKLQGPLQDSIAPGNWIGQFLGLNARTVTWTLTTRRLPKSVKPSWIPSMTYLLNDDPNCTCPTLILLKRTPIESML